MVLGLLALFYPSMTLAFITQLIGVGFLIAGIAGIMSYLRLHTLLIPVSWTLGFAIVDIVIGIVLLVHPFAASMVIPWLCGLAVLLCAGFELVAALGLRAIASPVWRWTFASAFVSALVGIIFFVVPTAVALLLGLFCVMQGISLVVYGYSISLSELVRK